MSASPVLAGTADNVQNKAREDAGAAVVLAESQAAGQLAQDLGAPSVRYAVSPDGRRLFAGWREAERLLVFIPPTLHASMQIVLVHPAMAGGSIEAEERDFGLAGAEEGQLSLNLALADLPIFNIAEAERGITLARYWLVRETLQLAVVQGTLDGFLDQATAFLKARSRPWYGSGIERAGDDPHMLRTLGLLISRRNALDELADTAIAAVEEFIRTGIVRAEARYVDLARHYAHRLARSLINEGIGLLGASSASGKHGFDRYWRAAAAHALRYGPARDAQALGQEYINEIGALP